MAVTVPPIPYKAKLLSATGYLTDPWAKWFREVFSRIGGTTALSNTELESMQTGGVDELQADVDALEVSVANLDSLATTHTTDIASLRLAVDGLGQGPVL